MNGSLEYDVFNVPPGSDASDVRAAVNAVAPTFWSVGGGYLPMFRATLDAEPVGGHTWKAIVKYQRQGITPSTTPPVDADPLDPGISFDLRGEPAHVQQSYSTYSSTPRPPLATAPNYSGAIGVNKDGTAEGVDVLTPALEFSVTRTFAAADVTHAYLKQIGALVGATNNAAWWAYQADEVRFLGATGAAQKDGSFPITYKFAVSYTQTSLQVAPAVASMGLGALTVPTKPGWYYLWVGYKSVTGPNSVIDIPAYAYVEQVYPRADFTLLGIG